MGGDRWLKYLQACVGVDVFPEAPVQVPALGNLTTARLSQWLGVLLSVQLSLSQSAVASWAECQEKLNSNKHFGTPILGRESGS